ncbi:ankyrin repeat-containing domain protein [Neocallimastix sp. 'constans']
MKIIKKQIINAISISSNTNNREKKRNRKSKEYNDKGHTSKWLKTNLNYEISKDKYKTILTYKKENKFYNNIFYIIKNGNKNLLKYLVEHGVDINKVVYKNGKIALYDTYEIVYKNGKIALYDTYESGNKDLVEYLVVKYGDYIINKENKSFETPLFRACKNLEEYLVEPRTNIDIGERGNKELVEYLIVERKAKIDKKQSNGETLLFYVCSNGNKDLVEYLVKHGADINQKTKWYYETPLFKACKNGNKDLVEYLVNQGVIIYKENDFGRTPIFDSYKSRNKDLEKYLIEKRKNIDKQDKDGETPLSSTGKI